MGRIWARVAPAILLATLPVFVILASLGPATAQENDAAAGKLTLPVFGPLSGEDGQQGFFQGTVSNLEFSNDGELILTGVLNGIASIGENSIRIADQAFESPVEPSVAGSVLAEDYGNSASGDADASPAAAVGGGMRALLQDNPTQPEPDPGKCDVLYLDIQPIALNLLGLEVLTSRITLDANAIPGEGNLAGNLICAVAGLLDGLPETMDEVTDQLNQIVSEAGAAQAGANTSGLGSLPVFGTFEGENGETGTFQGTVSDVVFADDGGAVVDGVLDGIANVGGDTVRVVDQPVKSPVTPSVGGTIPPDQYGNSPNQPTAQPTTQSNDTTNPTQPEPDPDKCDVLYLDIQPITLNLLGLEVLTSRITVDVNAIPGEGNLAGNLVCALAGLLDGTPDAIGKITDQLNQIADEIGVAPADAEATETPTDALTPTAKGGAEATEPATGATEPAAEPTTAPAEPTAPAQPTAPAEPTAPAQPTAPAAEPTAPAAETPAA